MSVILPTAANIGVLLVFVAVGYFLMRGGRLPASAARTLSALLADFFLPLYIVDNLAQNVRVDSFAAQASYPLLGLGCLALALAAAFPLARFLCREKARRGEYVYLFAFPNYGYFGYPLIAAVFGEATLAHTILYAVPFTVCIFTLGARLLVGGQSRWWKSLLRPVPIAVAVGAALGLLGWTLPEPVARVLSLGAGCMSPMSMMLTGVVLAGFGLCALFADAKPYLLSAIRLLALPAALGALLWAVGLRGEYLLIPVVACAMPAGMNLVVFPQSAGRDAKEGARVCFLSALLSLVTAPVVFWAVTALAA